MEEASLRTPHLKRPKDVDWQADIDAWSNLFEKLRSRPDFDIFGDLRGFKNNPGGAFKALYKAWSRAISRETKGAKDLAPAASGGRNRLASSLDKLFPSGDGSPVKNLNKKLAGQFPASAADAVRLVAALLAEWPSEAPHKPRNARERKQTIADAKLTADRFVRNLLSPLNRHVPQWTDDEMETRVFNLFNEERVGSARFVREAGDKSCALIVSGSKYVLLGASPVDVLKQFTDLTVHFTRPESQGLLIFVIDASLLDNADAKFDILYNLNLLSTAMQAFALFHTPAPSQTSTDGRSVSWASWQTIASRCAVVMRRPPLIDDAGKPVPKDEIDSFLSKLIKGSRIESLAKFKPSVPFAESHILPHNLPLKALEKTFLPHDNHYWDVLVTPEHDDSVSVQYFVPGEDTSMTLDDDIASIESGFRAQKAQHKLVKQIEDDRFYVTRVRSPGSKYDEAQRTIFRAVRGRLRLDSGSNHQDNMRAASVLRELGFEVLPAAIATFLLPKLLFSASAPRTSPV